MLGIRLLAPFYRSRLHRPDGGPLRWVPTDDPIFYTISERHDQRPAAEMLRIIERQMSDLAEPIRTSDPQ